MHWLEIICISDAFSYIFYNEDFKSKVEANCVSGI